MFRVVLMTAKTCSDANVHQIDEQKSYKIKTIQEVKVWIIETRKLEFSDENFIKLTGSNYSDSRKSTARGQSIDWLEREKAISILIKMRPESLTVIHHPQFVSELELFLSATHYIRMRIISGLRNAFNHRIASHRRISFTIAQQQPIL